MRIFPRISAKSIYLQTSSTDMDGRLASYYLGCRIYFSRFPKFCYLSESHKRHAVNHGDKVEDFIGIKKEVYDVIMESDWVTK